MTHDEALAAVAEQMDRVPHDQLESYFRTLDGMGEYFGEAADLIRSGDSGFVAFFYENVWFGHEADLKMYAWAEEVRAGREGRDPSLDDIHYLRDTMLSYTPSPFERGMAWLNKLREGK